MQPGPLPPRAPGGASPFPRAAGPAEAAWGTKACPSTVKPGIATNRVPGCTRRESCSIPETKAVESPRDSRAPGNAWRSDARVRGSDLVIRPS